MQRRNALIGQKVQAPQHAHVSHAPSEYVPATDIFAYENGDMDEEQADDFFRRLVDSRMIWHLQGSYGREAHRRGLI
jgi:hypothetical protein